MLNNFISGGQIFLDKVRMFKQVMLSSMLVSVVIGALVAFYIKLPDLIAQDYRAAITYVKADVVTSLNFLSPNLIDSNRGAARVDAYYKHGMYKKNILASSVLANGYFKSTYEQVVNVLKSLLFLSIIISGCFLILIFSIWSKFGKFVQEDKNIDGDKILTAKEVRSYLYSANQASSITIGDMPLVKNSENQHILITGATGSGKTNLIHNILPQARANSQPAIVIDQTGEMIAKYYDESRGDIIFNPFDDRSKSWDFWKDCCSDNNSLHGINDRLEKFAKILFGFNRNKQNSISSDPFWEESAEVIFTSCVETLLKSNNKSLSTLQQMVRNYPLAKLQKELAGTPAARYLVSSNKNTASSILSVLATSTKPLQYLSDEPDEDKRFSLMEYFKQLDNLDNNSQAGWIFLATKPSQRELTLPLIACMVELAVSFLTDIKINNTRRVWFVIDEISSLGRLPALSWLMSESRKYGGCIIAGMQSINQLFNIYGQYMGSTLFGQFATKFFFRTDEPIIAKMISALCGSYNISKQQKNISFGANEFRDGVSYTSQEKEKMLVQFKDLAKLRTGECFCLLPTPEARLAKLQVPQSDLADLNEGFVPKIHSNQNNEKSNESKTECTSNGKNPVSSSSGKSIKQMAQIERDKNTQDNDLEEITIEQLL